MSKKAKITIIVLSVLLSVGVLALAGILLYNYFNPSGVEAAVVTDNLISPEPAKSQIVSVSSIAETTSAALSLNNRNTGDNTPFQVSNMFPGDAVTKYYRVQVSYKGNVTVRYHADIRNGYEKLSEVFKCRIVLLSTGETLYDGLMKDMPKSLNKTLTADKSTVSELYYEITAYVDTSVGNEYQLKQLVADFRWWVEDTGNLDKPPKTGEVDFATIFIVAALLSFLLIIILLYKKKRKEADENEG